jgi:hypothetical protein
MCDLPQVRDELAGRERGTDCVVCLSRYRGCAVLNNVRAVNGMHHDGGESGDVADHTGGVVLGWYSLATPNASSGG